MKPYFETKLGKLYHGNALDVLKSLPDESVQMCVTSPPYWGLRDYDNEPQIWNGEYGEYFNNKSWKCVHVWGDEYLNKKVSQGQFCQHCNAWKGSLGLEPTVELFIKHMIIIFAEVKRVIRYDASLWLNLGDSMANKQIQGIPWRIALALQADGWYLRSDIIWHKPNPMPESCTDRLTKAHEYLFLLTKSAQYYYDADAIREPHKRLWKANNGGSMSTERHHNAHIGGTNRHKRPYPEPNPSGRNKRTVWTIPTEPTPEAHFATFPEKLVEPCILAGSAKGGIVLDPFIGSGKTATVAMKHGRKFVGIELSKPYLDDIAIPKILEFITTEERIERSEKGITKKTGLLF